jgi:hypothetical protein
MGGTISSSSWENFSVSAGYKGWIGIELGAYVTNGLSLDGVWDILFYIEPWNDRGNDGQTVNKTLYIDELWLTKLDQVPNI